MVASKRVIVAFNACARLVGAASIRAATGVDDFVCGDECFPGATNVNLSLCRISESDVHVLGACFDTVGRNDIQTLDLGGNEFTTLPSNIFEGMASITSLYLDLNYLQTLPRGVFEGLHSLMELDLRGNPGLQCVDAGSASLVMVEDRSILSSEPCGTRACLDSRNDNYRCTGCSSCEDLDLSSCRLTDADLCQVETCFKEASYADNIKEINIEHNDFTMSGEALVRGMLTPNASSTSMLGCDSPAAASEAGPAPSEDRPGDSRRPEALASRQARLQSRNLASISVGVLGKTYDVQNHIDTADEKEAYIGENAAITPAWDSAACLSHWGRAELIDTPDPDGYIIFVNGREQLGGNKFLVSDGLFIAKALGRTLVEYPVRNSRIVGFEDSGYGFGTYWDATELCMYNRILDLERFRMMTMDGRIPADNFVTITSAGDEHRLLKTMVTEDDVVKYFREHAHKQVIVMETMWRSDLERDAMQFLRPNPFFAGVVRTLLEEQQDWGVENFVAVQWRTERSTGNLTECYEEVKTIIENQRTALGYGRHQVFINIDLVAGTSGTYSDAQKAAGAELLKRMQRDYPASLDNRVHSFIANIADTGIKSIVAGLAAASSEVMLASSLNGKSHKTDPDACRCQKAWSGYIYLIAQWREQVMGTAAEGLYHLFPLGEYD